MSLRAVFLCAQICIQLYCALRLCQIARSKWGKRAWRRAWSFGAGAFFLMSVRRVTALVKNLGYAHLVTWIGDVDTLWLPLMISGLLFLFVDTVHGELLLRYSSVAKKGDEDVLGEIRRTLDGLTDGSQ
jgi:hypothetical protein